MFSNIDESVRRSPPLANVGRRSTPGSRKRAHVVFSGGRHLGLWNIGALTCTGENGLRATGKGLLRRPRSSRSERCQRARFDGAVASR
jgi:hypothetical protein